SSDTNYLILDDFDKPRISQGMQDRLYVGASFFREVNIQGVPLLRTIPLEMFQDLALKRPLPLIFPLIFEAVVRHGMPPLEEQEIRNAITGHAALLFVDSSAVILLSSIAAP